MNVKEVLNLYCNSKSQYEEAHGINLEGWSIIKDCGDIKFYGLKKSDGSTTLLMIFRAGLTQNWCGWVISEAQAFSLIKEFPTLYRHIEQINRRRRFA